MNSLRFVSWAAVSSLPQAKLISIVIPPPVAEDKIPKLEDVLIRVLRGNGGVA